MLISTKEVYGMIKNNKEVYIIDTRESIDYDKKHFTNSINIPIEVLPFDTQEYIKDKSKYIIIYSYSEDLCKKSIEILYNHGYSNVFYMNI